MFAEGERNSYVADGENHRIQVFRVSLRKFGEKGTREGELKKPGNIPIDSQNVT